MSARKKVLYVVHTHPAIRPGGAEGYALELHDAMRASGQFESVVLARSGHPQTTTYDHRDSPITLVGHDPNQFLFETDNADYDWFFGTTSNKALLTRHYRDFLLEQRPDVVHFQHTLYLGLDMLRVTRNVLPNAAIFYTLHEYLAICYRDGQLVRTNEDQLCLEQSPRRCHECFPAIPAREFLLRTQFAQAHFENVDLFISPSRFLRDRYVDWGVSAEKIVLEENGLRSPAGRAAEDDGREQHNRIAFFGQFSHYKGVKVLLKAMSIVAKKNPDVQLQLHGTNLEVQGKKFQDEFGELLADTPDNVILFGRYDSEQLPELMAGIDYVALPSLWWENSPRVIQEAFANGRPVICSGIGGMAEKVTDGVNGLHFRVGDPVSLADTILEAVKPGVWEQLTGNFPPVHTMDDHVRNLTRYYLEVIERRSGAQGGPATGRKQEQVA